MTTHTVAGITASHPRLLLLTLANVATVSTLYWVQAMLPGFEPEFGSAALLKLMPAAPLLGYALGVALLAGLARDLAAPRGLVLQLTCLVATLAVFSVARGPLPLLLASLILGLCCSLTQRLLACAADATRPEHRAEAIGCLVAGGLAGVVLARAVVPDIASLIGWRAMFLLDGVLVAAIGLALPRSAESSSGLGQGHTCAVPGAPALWRGQIVLRRTALLQACVFAAFNFGWAIYPRMIAGAPPLPIAPFAVASAGAAAALVCGRMCRTRDPAGLALIGAAGVAIGVALLLTKASALASLALALVDIGTQTALVANQARAQGLATEGALRGRLAAMVTTVGFAGGAIGAVLGNLIG